MPVCQQYRAHCSAVKDSDGTIGVAYTLSVSKQPSFSTVRSGTACKASITYCFPSPKPSSICFFNGDRTSCQFYNLFCSHILRVDGNPFITTCIQTNLAVSAVHLTHRRDPEAKSIIVWVAIALPRDSILCFHAYMALWAAC